jgi:hypothetical protein
VASGVEVQIDSGAVHTLVHDRSGPVGAELVKKAIVVQNEAKRLAPVATGNLRRSITWEWAERGGNLVIRVGTHAEHAIWVHEGTGVHGPRGAPIVPTHGRFLVFTPKGSSKPVFARQVQGMKGRPFLRDALRVLGAL